MDPPPLPGSFAQTVLREIRNPEARLSFKERWLLELQAFVFRPGFVAAGLALAASVGLALPALVAREAAPSVAASSLGLDVFSSAAPHVPSGLLSRAP